MHRHACRRTSLRRAAMGVPMENCGHTVTINRFFKAARAEVRENFRRLAFNGGADRRVVQYRDAFLRTKPCERGFELEGFIDRFLHERLYGALAPRTKSPAAETTGKSLDARKADPVHFGGSPVEHSHASIRQDLTNLVGLAALVVVVAEYCNDGNLHGRRQLADQDACFIW